jgi:tagatose-6-phosphate ketose/aldose isomerase
MKYLGIDTVELTRLGALHTAIEITQQPLLWQKIWQELAMVKPAIAEFLRQVLPKTKRIIITGAGSSAYIGLSLKGIFQQSTQIPAEAAATTDIVSNPHDYLLANTPTLIVSFARSGNSPESIAVIDLADAICTNCFHLVITCNAEGNLAKKKSVSPKFTITLPKESNDLSLAMTSSYSAMLLTGLLIMRLEQFNASKKIITTLSSYAQTFIARFADDLKAIAALPFKRAVFLGSGMFNGTATESNLKIQEFTGGQVIGKNDSFLGFRHGPKSVIDEHTLLVYLLSGSNEHSFRYEKDLIFSIAKGTAPMLQICVAETAPKEIRTPYTFYFSEAEKMIPDEFLLLCYILPAQVLGFYKSINLGLHPDAPSANNDITRVVEGVQIYALAED